MKSFELQGFAEMTSEEAQNVEGGGLRYLLYRIKRYIRCRLYGRCYSRPV